MKISSHFFFCLVLVCIASGQLLASAIDQQVTVNDYCLFLNATASTDSSDVYDGSSSCQVVRSGNPGGYQYDILEGRGDAPMKYLSWSDGELYCAWKENAEGSIFYEACEAAPDQALKSNQITVHYQITSSLTGLNKQSDDDKSEEELWGRAILGSVVVGIIAAVGVVYCRDQLHCCMGNSELRTYIPSGNIRVHTPLTTGRGRIKERWVEFESSVTSTPGSSVASTPLFSSRYDQMTDSDKRYDDSFITEEGGDEEEEMPPFPSMHSLQASPGASVQNFSALLQQQKEVMNQLAACFAKVDSKCMPLESRLHDSNKKRPLTAEEEQGLCRNYQELLDYYDQRLLYHLLQDQTLESYAAAYPEERNHEAIIGNNRKRSVAPLCSDYHLDLGDILKSWKEVDYPYNSSFYAQRQKEVRDVHDLYGFTSSRDELIPNKDNATIKSARDAFLEKRIQEERLKVSESDD